MKRIMILLALALLTIVSAYASLDASAAAEPSAVEFEWNAVDGASFYDIYSGEEFIARLPSDARSYHHGGLDSGKEYSFSIAARDASNNTLEAAFLKAETGWWDGIYEWRNLTDDDNRGRMRSLRVRVETAEDPVYGQHHRLYMIMDDRSEARIFPLYDFGDPKSGQWESYKGDGTAATAYRLNADRLNTSIINPSKWRLDSITLGPDHGSAHVETRAFGITADIIASYRLFVEDGIMKMEYSTAGSGAAEAILFCNPNPGEGDSFVLVRQDIPQDSI